jgi:hypothetical protein
VLRLVRKPCCDADRAEGEALWLRIKGYGRAQSPLRSNNALNGGPGSLRAASDLRPLFILQLYSSASDHTLTN